MLTYPVKKLLSVKKSAIFLTLFLFIFISIYHAYQNGLFQGLRKRPVCKYHKKIFNQAIPSPFIWGGNEINRVLTVWVVVLQS